MTGPPNRDFVTSGGVGDVKKNNNYKNDSVKVLNIVLPSTGSTTKMKPEYGKLSNREMAVKKHELVANESNQLDLEVLATYIQLLNDQPPLLPSVPDLVQNCEDIVNCLASSPGNEERRWEMLQSIEEFLVRVVNTVKKEARTAIVNAVIKKFYSYISDPQWDAKPATEIVLVVLDTSSMESIMQTTRWMVQQGENEPASVGLRASLSCLFSWVSEVPNEGSPVLGDFVLSFIKALEEKKCFEILIDVSLKYIAVLFYAMSRPSTLRQSNANAIFHVLASMRESPEAFERITTYIRYVLTKLASDNRQFSRQLLQNAVDVLTAWAEHLHLTMGEDKIPFYEKYSDVYHCLGRHMVSPGCELLKIPPWTCPVASTPSEPQTTSSEPSVRKVGLTNQGNSCYMNSVLQALLVTRRFSNHVMLHMTNRPYWELAAMLFGKLVHSVTDKLNTRLFIKLMRPSFFHFIHQQDSYEYLGYFFELLQSYEHIIDENYDYSRRPVLGFATAQSRSAGVSNSDSDTDGASSNQREVSPRPGGSGGASSSNKRTSFDPEYPNKRSRFERRFSFVDSVFGGVLLTRVQCMVCKFTSVNRDVFRDLPLAFPEQDVQHSVQSLLEYFCQKEPMTGNNRYRCPTCGVLREAERTVIIETAPNFLILVVKHFKFEPKSLMQMKLKHDVYYNGTIHLTLPGNRNETVKTFSLYAAIIHSGHTLNSGHYYTLAKDGDSWYEFNDAAVTLSAETKINELNKATTPYILFYRRDDIEMGSAPSLEELPAKIQEHVLAHNKQFLDRP